MTKIIGISGNDSTTALDNGSTFTGEWQPVPIGSLLLVNFKSDVAHTIQIQYSVDNGTNVDSTLYRYFSPSFIFPPQIFKNARPFMRVVVTNGSGSNATYMRLNTTCVDTGEPLLNIPVDATMSKDYSALSTRPTGFSEEVALGRRQGWTTWNKFGYNNDVDTGTEIVAAFGGTFSRMTSADTLSIVSSDANDTNGGTGVNTIVIYGIDGNRDPQTKVYNMDGLTPVVTTDTWLGVNRVAIFLFGSGEANAGNITITATSAGSTQAYIPAGDGVTQQMIFHVPRDHNFLATYLYFNVNKISGGASPVVTLKGLVYSAVNGGVQEVWRETIDTSVVNDIEVVPTEPFPISEKSILYFTATTNSDNTVVNGRFGGKLVRDVDA